MNDNSNIGVRLGALRTALYAFSIALLGVLAANNIIEQKTIDAVLSLIFPMFALGVAIYNVFPKKKPAPDIVLPTVDEVADAVVARLSNGKDVPVARRDDVPSLEDIVAGVVSGITEMPAPAPQPVPHSDHGVEVQGVTSDAPVAN